mmetsp:Transcript_15945/g.38108  ORF Transcript_15945/g.38108 Transcript_15945/m.38108 type:complete len:212 (+) Transcript_15945:2595-3230(+)
MGIPTGHLRSGTESRRRKADGNALGIQGLFIAASIVSVARSWFANSMLSASDMTGQREVATQRHSAAGNGSTKGGTGKVQKWRHLGTLGRNTAAVMMMMMRIANNITGTGGGRKALSEGGSSLSIFLGDGMLDDGIVGKNFDFVVGHKARSHIDDGPIGILRRNVRTDEGPKTTWATIGVGAILAIISSTTDATGSSKKGDKGLRRRRDAW